MVTVEKRAEGKWVTVAQVSSLQEAEAVVRKDSKRPENHETIYAIKGDVDAG